MILLHPMPVLQASTMPSSLSLERIKPGCWSGAYQGLPTKPTPWSGCAWAIIPQPDSQTSYALLPSLPKWPACPVSKPGRGTFSLKLHARCGASVTGRPVDKLCACRVWGMNNREAPLRVCTDAYGEPNNVEYKTLDATANPYLALAVLIIAGLEVGP